MNTPDSPSAVGIVVSHSHWDRAWYQPFAWFRHRLVLMIDRIIHMMEENPHYSSFTLDGQTILLDDYLEIRPQNRQRLMRLVRNGRIRIGPWFILPDLFLVSGESVIRNLQLAHKTGLEFGNLDKTGYVPDPFGHFAQLPQVLRQFGIDTFFFMRGMPLNEFERLQTVFEWQAPDGSRVLSVYLKEGYYNLSALGQRSIIGRFDLTQPDAQKAVEQVASVIHALKQHQTEPVFLLLNGMDHMPEQKELPELLQFVNQNQTDIKLQHGTLSDFIDLLKPTLTEKEVYTGDLLGNAHHPILSSVWSTRTYLKTANYRSQSLLEKFLEPTLAIQECLLHIPTDWQFLDTIWKELLKNHPHDDICGCSIDPVHRENEIRFEQVDLMAEHHQLLWLENCVIKGFEQPNVTSGKFKADLIVQNPHPFTVVQWLKTSVFFENPEGEFGPSPENLHLTITNASGETIPFVILSSQDKRVQMNYVNNVWGRFYQIEFEAKVDGLGYELFHVTNNSKPAEIQSSVPTQQIENNHYKLICSNSEVILVIKTSNRTITNPFVFESCRDAGDSYSFGPVKDDAPKFSIYKGVVSSDLNRKQITLAYDLPQFQSLNVATEITLKIELTISLQNDSFLDYTISYENNASDSRVRFWQHSATFATKALSDAHFRLAERTIIASQSPEEFEERYQSYPGELNYPQQHQLDFSILNDGKQAFWSATHGLHEFELIQKQDCTWYVVTLHRSVGWLSVGNSRIRRPQAGPQLEVPEAQCKRAFLLRIQSGYPVSISKDTLQTIQSSAHPIQVKQLPTIENQPLSGSLPRKFSAVSWENSKIKLSAFKPTATPGILAIRLVNLDAVTQKTTINFGFSIISYQFCDLHEHWEPLAEKKPTHSSSLNIELSPHKIRTILIKTKAFSIM